MNDGSWFRRGSWNRGVLPSTWQGWLVTILIIVALVGVNVAFIAYVALTRHPHG